MSRIETAIGLLTDDSLVWLMETVNQKRIHFQRDIEYWRDRESELPKGEKLTGMVRRKIAFAQRENTDLTRLLNALEAERYNRETQCS